MKEFDFTLKFAFSEVSADAQDYLALLFEAGCDDAIVGIGKQGRVALQFSREAKDAYGAISSAINDVKRAIPNARLIEATPDFVGLSDIAKLLGCSRQYIRKLMTENESFPLPVHSGKTEIWHLCRFLDWYEVEHKKQVEYTVREVASINMQINLANELSQLDLETQHRVVP
ncbi:DNA-binding protein [Pseudidiomarina gelatinasegens]|jgi:predicted DNA-binding transcriptional regulator AlpA|uniref:DNA-binding protein n=1 Tax=Pseudidiomarina gelatinasegens TaxID=2487740 RepID=A0A443YVM8_9GAMM|nr:DNA-binding protein [Pseudidiomarina gelatinasegens]RWU08000.1 DNA-binding protein [Pseudidiomarina gelatinasegens]